MSDIGNSHATQSGGLEGTVERSFDTPGPVTLRVQNGSGKVEIETVDASSTEIRVVALGQSAIDIVERARIVERATGRGHEVVVEVPQARGRARFWLGNGSSVAVYARVPVDSELDITTASASVGAVGRYQEVSIHTASGEVDLGEVAGQGKIRTASGDVAIEGVGDVVNVQTASGDVRIGVAAAGGKVSTASGDVRLDQAGRAVRVRTASGDVSLGEVLEGAGVETVSGDLRIERALAGDLILRSVSGDVAVAVAPGALVRFDAGSMSGRVSSEIEIEADRPVTGGEVEGPELFIQATSVSGNIVVTRALP